MLIILPPSEGKTAPLRGRPIALDRLSFPALGEGRVTMLEALSSLCSTTAPGSTPDTGQAQRAAERLGLGSTQLDEVARNAALPQAPTARADRVYSGVLYEALGLPTLASAARRRAASRVVITSALFGLLRPDDRIPAYRLSGTVSLPGLGPVAAFWRSRLDPAVRGAAGRGLVVDLRSSTYSSFWRPAPDLVAHVVTVRVLHETDGDRKTVSHFNKATKGRLVRALLEDGGAPATASAFADHLGALGYKVEHGGTGRHGTRFDIVVDQL